MKKKELTKAAELVPQGIEKTMLNAEDVKKYIAINATDKELFLFLGICKSYGLNPFKREIHFVKYGQNAASIIVGYEIYLKRAERTGKLDGWKCWIEKGQTPEEDRAFIEIQRKDQTEPICWDVKRAEFDKKQATWVAMPEFMLKKVAIAQGFRLAFPDELGGIPYIPEEISVTIPLDTPTIPETPPAKTEPAKAEPVKTERQRLLAEIHQLIIDNGLNAEEIKERMKSDGWTPQETLEYIQDMLSQKKEK